MQMAAAYLQWKPSRLRIGILGSQTTFSIPIQFADKPENVNKFSGNRLTHTSADWKWLYGRMYLFGEVGYEWQKKATALTAGMQVQAADGLLWIIQFRNITPKWYAPYSQPFSETGREGERGIYLGLNWQLPKHFNVAFYADHFQYTWLRSNLNRPGTGRDYMLQLNFVPRSISTYVRFRFQERLRTLSSEETIKPAAMETRVTARWHATYNINQQIALQTRIEWAESKHETTSNGFLGFVGTRIYLTKKWQLRLRYILFDTQCFSSAIYAYEDDLPYSFTVPAYFNTGSKWYVLASYKINSAIECWVRISDVVYPDLTSLGSGNDLISEGRRTEIKAMMRFTF